LTQPHDVQWTDGKARQLWEAYHAIHGATGVYPSDFYEVVLDLVGNLVKPRSRCLDVGCGSGVLAELLAGRRHRVVAIDFTAANVDDLRRRWAKRKEEIDVRVQNLTALALPDASFDAAFATEVLEHVSDEKLVACLDEIRRVLVPGGVFVATTPYAERLEKVICPDCLAAFHPMGHVQSFDEARAAATLQAGRLTPVRITRFPTIFVGRTDGQLKSGVKRAVRSLFPRLCVRLRGHNLFFAGRKIGE
jgi:SAM-dependent methyltransferase